MRERRYGGERQSGDREREGGGIVPGKRTLTETIYRAHHPGGAAPMGASEAFATASAGTGSEVPFRRDMERSFGEDFGGVRAYLGGGNAIAGLGTLGARAAAQGETIAFESSTPDKALVAHELTHVVQQRRGGASSPQGKGEVSTPGDAAEVEADQVAAKVVAGERVTVLSSAGAAIHRDIKDPGAKVAMGEFAISMKKVEEADFQGEDGEVKFTPNDKAPDSKSVRLTQAIRYFDLGTKKDFDWSGSSEADRSKMNTTAKDEKITSSATDTLAILATRFYGTASRAGEIHAANKAVLKSDKPGDLIGAGVTLTIPKAVEQGFHVDHFPSDAAAEPRKKAADKNVPQDYVWPGEETPPKNQHGSKAGRAIVPASLHDRPGWNKDMKYSFETVARSDDVGVYYGGMVWGFTIKSNKVVDEHHSVSEAPSQTFQAAVTEFNEFYKNTHTVMQGDTLEGLATRYLGDKAKADEIYNANKAKIPDKSHLAVGTKLVIPGVSATGK
jgi:nucleoid-associated protein YgaU